MSEEHIFVAGFDRILFAYARAAAGAATAATVPAEGGAQSVAAVLTSAAGLEAHVGEWVARFGDQHGIGESKLKTWRNRGLPEVVKDILGIVKPETSIDRFAWYNKLCSVYKIRNGISHYFPEPRPRGDWPDDIKGVITGKLITPDGNATMDWTSRIFTAKVVDQVLAHVDEARRGFDDAVGWAA